MARTRRRSRRAVELDDVEVRVFKTVSALEHVLAVHFQDEKGELLLLSDEHEILRRAGRNAVKADEVVRALQHIEVRACAR